MKCVKINLRIKNARTFYRSLVGNKYFWFSVIKLLIYFAFDVGRRGGRGILLQARVTLQLIYTGT